MYETGTEHPWLLHYGFNMMVDFCVWVLEKDGLQVLPFDTHPEGNTLLRNAGLQASEWKSWMAKVVDLQYHHSQVLQQQAATKTEQTPPSVFLPAVFNPPLAWSGTASVKEPLYAMWEQYMPVSKLRRKWEKPAAEQWRQSNIAQQLWTHLQLYKTRLPSLIVHLVEYSQPVEYFVPPISIILSLNDDHLDGEAFCRRVIHAVERLLLA